ncbi:uncharacterized protein LOC132715152, partial [Ruditapes philippinarum]|uniref:uncharacterized protein LOC132715152 n=1 Tax=Ruditapes philippinarum TaxID=129788 RepID=UPI00295BB652
MVIDVHLVALAVLAIINTGLGVSIQTTSSLDGEESYECGRNITLSCMFKKNTSVIVWGKANSILRIARCDKTTCTLNPAYIGLYSISFDMTQGIFNLTIIKVTAEENGTKLICSDGSHSDSYILRVYDPAVIIPKTDSLGDTIQAECGRSLSLSCKFRKNTFAIVWKFSDDILPIAKCQQNNCSLNPNFVGQFYYFLDKTRCMFTQKIIKVTNKYNERKLVCSDGTHSDFQIIKVG